MKEDDQQAFGSRELDLSHFTWRIRITWIKIRQEILLNLKSKSRKFISNTSDNRISELEIIYFPNFLTILIQTVIYNSHKIIMLICQVTSI